MNQMIVDGVNYGVVKQGTHAFKECHYHSQTTFEYCMRVWFMHTQNKSGSSLATDFMQLPPAALDLTTGRFKMKKKKRNPQMLHPIFSSYGSLDMRLWVKFP